MNYGKKSISHWRNRICWNGNNFQLLQKGYIVKTSVRLIKSKDKIVHTLKSNKIKEIGNLYFVEVDLTKDGNWNDIMQNCEYVLSVESPVF